MIRVEVEEAAAYAVKEADPPVEAVYTDIYLNTPDLVIRGTNPDVFVTPKHHTSRELLQAQGKMPEKKKSPVLA